MNVVVSSRMVCTVQEFLRAYLEIVGTKIVDKEALQETLDFYDERFKDNLPSFFRDMGITLDGKENWTVFSWKSDFPFPEDSRSDGEESDDISEELSMHLSYISIKYLLTMDRIARKTGKSLRDLVDMDDVFTHTPFDFTEKEDIVYIGLESWSNRENENRIHIDYERQGRKIRRWKALIPGCTDETMVSVSEFS